MIHLFNSSFEIYRKDSILGEFNRPQKILVSKGKFRGRLDQKQARVIVGEPQNISEGDYILYTYPEIDIRHGDIIKIDGSSYRASRPFKYRVHMEVNLSISEEV